MNLHRMTEPPAPPPPEPVVRTLYGDDRELQDYFDNHGVDEVACLYCSRHTFKRRVTYIEEKFEHITLPMRDQLREGDGTVEGSSSSGEFVDDDEDGAWECADCGATVDMTHELTTLFDNVYKEVY